jgi:outer membrane protein assembly factor BamB
VRDDEIVLLGPDGARRDSRSILDAHDTSDLDIPLLEVGVGGRGGPPWVDPFHANSVEWLRDVGRAGSHPIYQPGTVLVSLRHQNRVVAINWERNQVVWEWGQGEIFGPHDAQLLDNGHVLVFDNGMGRRPAFSRGVEVDPISGEIVWEFRDDPPTEFYTRSKGSVQRLPNGNTLLAASDSGHAFEVTPEGDKVWEWISPHRLDGGRRAAIVRMRRLEPEFVEPLLRR